MDVVIHHRTEKMREINPIHNCYGYLAVFNLALSPHSDLSYHDGHDGQERRDKTVRQKSISRCLAPKTQASALEACASMAILLHLDDR